MGEESKEVEFVACIGGEYKTIKKINAISILEAKHEGELLVNTIANEARYKANLKMPKYFRCKTKKRLIKLLMANKMSRNEAIEMADAYSCLTYQGAWNVIWPYLLFR